jgi:hypothetical protein
MLTGFPSNGGFAGDDLRDEEGRDKGISLLER